MRPRKYQCDVCGKRFERSQALGIHRRLAHGIKGKQRGVSRQKRKELEPEQERGTRDRLIDCHRQLQLLLLEIGDLVIRMER